MDKSGKSLVKLEEMSGKNNIHRVLLSTQICQFWGTGGNVTQIPVLEEMTAWRHIYSMTVTATQMILLLKTSIHAKVTGVPTKHSITRVQIASRFFHWNTEHFSLSFRRKMRAINDTCIPMEKARRDMNPSDPVFLPFGADIYEWLVPRPATISQINCPS